MKKLYILFLLTVFFSAALSAQMPSGTYVPITNMAKQMQFAKFECSGNKIKMYAGYNGVSLGVAEEYTFSMKGNVISIKDGNTNVETLTYDRARDIIFYDMQASYELLAGFGNILAGATGEKRKKISSQEVEMFFQQLGVQPPVWGKNGTSYTPPKTTPIITIYLENDESNYIKVGGNVSNATNVSIDILDKTTGQKTSGQSVNRTGDYWNYVLTPVSQGHTYKFAIKATNDGGDVWAEKEVTVEYQFDRNNIAYVYIVNESQAVPIVVWKGGHNFIMFEDNNGCGAVYSYGPVITSSDYPARMWIGTFTKKDFQNALKNTNFVLSAERVKYKEIDNNVLGISVGTKWEYENAKYIYDRNVNQAFDRYVKFSVSKDEGIRMIDYADTYLLNYPHYAALTLPGGKGQCDDMTKRIADKGGLGYYVSSTPNLSYDQIVNWGGIGNGENKKKFIDKYP